MRVLPVLLFLFLVSPAFADDVITKPSNHDVATTIDRLVDAVQGKGMKVFVRIDHAAGAATIGQTLAPVQVLIFGSVQAGTPLMQKDPRVGLDLPLRVLAYQDADGKTWLNYHDPRGLRTRYTLGELPVPDKMFTLLGLLTDTAAAP